MELTNTFIYLLGLPGTGKLTIAKELQKLFPAILVDNHLINNVVFSLIDTDGKTKLPPQVWVHTRQIRNVVLETIRGLSKPNRNFIFTNALTQDDPLDWALYQEIVNLAQDRGAKFLAVRMLISPEELCRRVVSAERKSMLKEIDPESAKRNALKFEVLKPDGCFEIDVTNLSASEAAGRIAAYIERKQ